MLIPRGPRLCLCGPLPWLWSRPGPISCRRGCPSWSLALSLWPLALSCPQGCSSWSLILSLWSLALALVAFWPDSATPTGGGMRELCHTTPHKGWCAGGVPHHPQSTGGGVREVCRAPPATVGGPHTHTHHNGCTGGVPHHPQKGGGGGGAQEEVCHTHTHKG